MPFQLDYRHIFPRQSQSLSPSSSQQQQITTTVGSPGVTPTGLDNGTTVINVSPTATDLGLGNSAVRHFILFYLGKTEGLADPYYP